MAGALVGCDAEQGGNVAAAAAELEAEGRAREGIGVDCADCDGAEGLVANTVLRNGASRR